jgi:hypothetical protein
MKPLDFIIIGAQKSGTTSLFKYLQPHPRIFMPANKEAPYFSDDDAFERGWEPFAADYFSGADERQFWGTASPQYMGNSATPARMHAQMPNARLIALLRDPVDRAYSHYKMQVRRNFETRTFDQAVAELCDVQKLTSARAIMPTLKPGDSYEDETEHYLVWGEYGRILDEFLNYYNKDQLLVLSMDEMIENPIDTFKQVTAFIGINDDLIPSNVGQVYHKGGTKQIIPDSWRTAIKTNPAFRFFWNKVPERIKQNVRYWYDQKNVHKSRSEAGPSAQAQQQLVQHFADDVRRLEQIAGRAMPWPHFH